MGVSNAALCDADRSPRTISSRFFDEDVSLQILLPFVRDTVPAFVALLIEPATDISEALTDRGREILQLIATGLSNHEIAQRLVVSIGTIEPHSQYL